MEFYAGIDLHTRKSVVCVIDEKERKLVTAAAPNDLLRILSLLEEAPRRPVVAVEATLNWYWLVDGLQEAGYKVKLAHTMGFYMITDAKVKTDRRDAFSLARLLRLDAIPEAYIYPKELRHIRDVLRRRTRLVRLPAEAYVAIKRKFRREPPSHSIQRMSSSAGLQINIPFSETEFSEFGLVCLKYGNPGNSNSRPSMRGGGDLGV